MNRWTRYRKGDCPVCGTRKDCRGKDDLIFCRGDNPSPSYTFLGQDRNGFGIYKLTEDINQEKQENREEWIKEQKRKRELRIKEEMAKRANSLSITQRNQELRKLINQLTLEPHHKKNLINRGMSESHINRRGYVSIEQWQKLSSEINYKLAGINTSGFSLNNYQSGFIVPITNVFNQLIGYQIANDDRETAKYVWASSKTKKRPNGATSHLKEYVREDGSGELPLQVTGNKEGKIILIEGTLKPDVSSSLSKDLFIGASGGNFSGCKNQLKKTLETLNQQIIYYALDAGSVANSNVLRQVVATIKLVHSWGYSILIMNWGQLHDKNQLDYDDLLNSGNIPEINYIDGFDFLKSYCNHKIKLEGEISRKEFEKKFKKLSKPDLTQEYYVNSEQWQQWIEEKEESDFIEFLKYKVLGFGKKLKKGFGYLTLENLKKAKETKVKLPEIINYDPDIPLPLKSDYEGKPAPKIIFKKGQRQKVITQLISLGWLDTIDNSVTGSGKSHNVGTIENTKGKLWYLDINHRNVSTPTIKANFEDLQPRHNGIYQNELGELKLAITDEKKAQAIFPSNCMNSSLFNTFYQKGYNPNFSEGENLNPICKSCKLRFNCVNGVGEGFGFRAMRKESLSHPKIRADINSLPNKNDYDFSQDIAIVEESGKYLKRHEVVKAGKNDIILQLFEVRKKGTKVDKILSLINTIVDYLSGENIPTREDGKSYEHPLYGINSDDLMNILPPPPEGLEDVIKDIYLSLPDIEDYLPDTVEEKLSRSQRKTINAYFRNESIKKIEKLPSNILINLLEVWGGFKIGAIRIDKKGKFRELILTIEDNSDEQKLKAFKTRIHLDATSNKYYLAKILDINPNEIITIQEETKPIKNLTIYNTQMKGLGSNAIPSGECQKRIKSYIEEILNQYPETQVLAPKSWDDNLNGYWFNHNRGSNKFKGKKYLLTFGLPQPHVGAMKDIYKILFPNQDDFDKFYEEQIKNEVVQTIGRQRVQRYPHQHFYLDIVNTGANLNWITEELGIKIINREAFEVTPEAGNPNQIARKRILDAIALLKKAHQKVTQKAIAKLTGVSQQNISKHLRALSSNWKEVFEKYNYSYKDIYRGSCKIDKDIDDLFRTWLDLDRIEAAREFVEIIVNQGWEGFKVYLDMVSDEIRSKILFTLLSIVKPELTEKIIQLE